MIFHIFQTIEKKNPKSVLEDLNQQKKYPERYGIFYNVKHSYLYVYIVYWYVEGVSAN